ncbi:MAG: PTS sugar transporter subunit IIA [Lachnospiraceae bacterium]|nr:PTS sugar transporter subunit IIA [Lachnospiraceae bacterium]
MDIREVLKKEHILLDIEASTREEVLQQMAENLLETKAITDADRFVKQILEREKLGFTGAGNGIAIPHGVSDQINQILVAVARVKETVYWESEQENIPENEKNVNFIILFAIPQEVTENQEIRYIKVLQTICQNLMDKEKIKFLMRTQNESEIINYFNGERRNENG